MRVTCSGPKRFEYDFNTKKWLEVEEQDGVKNTRRVNDDINSLLAKEMKSLFGLDMHFCVVCCVLSLVAPYGAFLGLQTSYSKKDGQPN